MSNPFQDFLIIDIETVSGNKSMEDLAAVFQKHWEQKTTVFKNHENKTSDELYEEKAAIYAEFGKVVTIGMGVFSRRHGQTALRVKSLAYHDEKKLLQEFKDFIESKFDQEKLKLCAHNGKEFDFPYLCRRMLVHGIKIPISLNMTGKKPWEVNHIDTMELWKFGDRKSFTSLDLLTALFNIPSSKEKLEGSMVTKTYYAEEDSLKKIEEYCRRDVIATAQVYLRLNNCPPVDDGQITIANE